MGMELDAEDSFDYDSYAVAFVQHALKAAIQGDRDDYDQMVVLMDPSINVNPNDPASLESKEDKEALLVATLRALSEVVSHIDVSHHRDLYTSILGMSIWKCQPIVKEALIDLVVCLAASSGSFLDACLDMLVCHFMPPPIDFKRRWLSLKNDVVDRVFSALQDIADLVPLAPMRLLPIIVRRMPPKHAPKPVIEMYVECMLKLEMSTMGEFIGSSLLKAVVDMLVDLDVDIRWEEILVNDSNKGIFDMELEDMEGNEDVTTESILTPYKMKDTFKGNKVAETLDSLMTITCKHLQMLAKDGRFTKVFETLMESFQRTVLTAYKPKFVQFVMFYACSLDPEVSGAEFSHHLLSIFLSKTEPLSFRISAISYLASYLSRAKFLSSSFVANSVISIVDWCFEYCCLVDVDERALVAREVFYFGCQAIMYILCFRMRSIVDDPDPRLKNMLDHMPLEAVMSHALDPLKVCLPAIVEEFLRQAKAACLFAISMTFTNLHGSELSKTFGGVKRLDTFYPFDPYLLKESDRFIRPHYEFWSTMRTTNNLYSEDEDEDEDEYMNDVSGHKKEVSINHPELDDDNDLGLSMNKMSITPRNGFISHTDGNEISRMPARIRPSRSPH